MIALPLTWVSLTLSKASHFVGSGFFLCEVRGWDQGSLSFFPNRGGCFYLRKIGTRKRSLQLNSFKMVCTISQLILEKSLTRMCPKKLNEQLSINYLISGLQNLGCYFTICSFLMAELCGLLQHGHWRLIPQPSSTFSFHHSHRNGVLQK